jgi:molybdopterin-containing oxidoreductase family iron-sulfur binding subunit
VQRIREAEIQTRIEQRGFRSGEVRTACQQACPTAAIVFGNISDPADPVSQDKAEPHSYAMLDNLNTRPRTTYLAAVRNPAPNGSDTE